MSRWEGATTSGPGWVLAAKGVGGGEGKGLIRDGGRDGKRLDPYTECQTGPGGRGPPGSYSLDIHPMLALGTPK